jgi:hypothetical protein
VKILCASAVVGIRGALVVVVVVVVTFCGGCSCRGDKYGVCKKEAAYKNTHRHPHTPTHTHTHTITSRLLSLQTAALPSMVVPIQGATID